jgi:hypothetical protein
MYGIRVQEPLSSEFAFSGGLASSLLKSASWQERCAEAGAGMALLSASIVQNARVCQSFLGPRVYGSNPEANLVQVFQDSLAALFKSAEVDQGFWLARTESSSVPSFGFEYSVALRPVRVSRKRLQQSFRLGVDQLGSILETVLAPETWRQIQALARLSDEDFRFPDELWATTTYDVAAAYHRSVLNREHLLQAMLPLYRGRIYSFVLETERYSSAEIEKRLEELYITFERLKPYLVERWSA